MKIRLVGRASLGAALLLALTLPVSAADSASTEDVILLAECGGFFNAYGSLVGRSDLSKTGNRLAAKVLDQEEDARSLAISYERGGEFADSWYESEAAGEIVDYIQMCSKVVSRNMEYLRHAT